MRMSSSIYPPIVATCQPGWLGAAAWRGLAGRSCGTGGGTPATGTSWWAAGRTQGTTSPGDRRPSLARA